MEQIEQGILEVTSPLKLPAIDVGAIARTVATKTASADIPAQLLFLPGQYLLVTRVSEAVTYKFLSPSAVTAAFSNEPIDSGWLPASIVRWGCSEQGEWMVQFYSPARYSLILSREGVETVVITSPMPAFVFFGRGNNYWLWALKDKQFNSQCQVYHAPLPNVMSTGAICFGDNSPPPCSPQGISEAWKLFWNSVFTDHVVDNKSKFYPKDVRHHLWLLHERKTKQYPTKDLILFSRLTINSQVEQILQC